MTKREREMREEISSLKESLARAERMDEALREEYGRHLDALEHLMKFVCSDLADQLNHPTSIHSNRVIAALAETSRILHDRDRR